jgi:hypothetical protein
MLLWLLHNGFRWVVRAVVLLVAVLTCQHVLTEELGYRMDFKAMLVLAILTIVTVRVWMPWEGPSASK